MRPCLKLEMNKDFGMYVSSTELAQHMQCSEFSPQSWKHEDGGYMPCLYCSDGATDVNICVKSFNCTYQTHATFEY